MIKRSQNRRPRKWSCICQGTHDGAFTRETLKNAFEKNYKGKFVYVKANSRGSAANEQFKSIEAYKMSGFDYDAFIKLLEHGKIFVDLRIGLHFSFAKNWIEFCYSAKFLITYTPFILMSLLRLGSD